MLLRKKSADGLTMIEIRRLKRKRKKTRKKILLSIMLMLMICVGILFTPLFNLHEIEVNGNLKIKTDELIKASGFIMGENIFKFKLNESGERVSQIPYVNSVFIKRKLPGRIEINVTESIPMGYISYNDKLLVVDKDGKVLEAKNEKINYQIPILSDFKVSQFTLGKKINEKDEEKLKKTLEIAKNLYNNNLIDKIVSITSQKDDFYLIVNDNLKIVIGDTENLSGKLVMLKEVLNKLPEDATGIIDARNADKVYHRT